ncbi:MAG TPA: AMP-binding protein [Acidimicrobiales bacterium]|jgi:2-aminobenzoate-CoA ligase
MALPLSESAHVDPFPRDHLPPADEWPDLRFDLPELRYPDRLNCATELLDRTVARMGGDRRCLVSDSATWTYADLLAHANRIAHVLVDDLGVVPGNRVVLRAPNNPELVACWFAVLKAGAVVVTTMPLLRRAELVPICERSLPSAAICDDRLLDELRAAAAGGLPVLPVSELLDRAPSKPATFDDVPTAADDVALIAFTSGTTGAPKGCMHFHRDVLAIADTFSAHVLRPRPDDLFCGSPPLGFTFGLGGLVVFPMRVGAASLLLEQAGPPQLLEGIARHRATISFTAPTAYRAMVRLLDGDARDLSSLRTGVSAGEALPKATWHAFHDATGVPLVDGIGATELLHIFISASGDAIRPGSTGVPVPGYEAMVVDDDGEPVPDGEIGRLAVRGPTGCRYLADERQRRYVQRGWNLTGDSYVRDADGYFWFQARSDDMIISAGYNIAGPEVEDALLRHPDVAECAVVGVPDEERGSIVKAYVVLADGVPATADTAAGLQDFVKKEIAPYKYPRSVAFLDALPKTQTGKLQRFRLRELG